MNYTTPDSDKQFNSNGLVPELPFLTQVPKVLKPYDNWVCWQYHQSGESLIRIPVTPQANLESAYKLCQSEGYGLGFLLTPENPIAAICIAGYKDEHNHLLPDTEDILKISKTYTEIDDRVGELYVVGFADGEWNVGKDRIRIVSDEFVVPITVDTIGAFSNVSDCQQAFATVARRYCSLSWLEKFETMRESCDEFTALARVLTECLDTPNWMQDAESTDLYEFFYLFWWDEPRLKRKVEDQIDLDFRDFGSRSRAFKSLEAILNKMKSDRKPPRSRASRDNAPECDEEWTDDLHYDTKGRKVLENFYNMVLIMENHSEWKDRIRFDSFRNLPMLDDEPVKDTTEYRISEWFGKNYEFGGNRRQVLSDAIKSVASKHGYDALLEWIDSLPEWDGIKRIDTWMIDLCGSDKGEYSEWVSRVTILQMMNRALNPGCIARLVPIWNGIENQGKSTAVALLGGEWATTLKVSLENKEAHMAIHGYWIAELEELDTLYKTSEARLKAFLTNTSDHYVPKYANHSVDYPRRTVFIGTTNDSDYLRGLTGNTRFLPINTGVFDLEGIKANREQLFAEAKAWLLANPGASWWQEPDGLRPCIQEERDSRRIVNVYEDDLKAFLDGTLVDGESLSVRLNQTTWDKICTDYFKFHTKDQWKDKSLQSQVTDALKAIGWYRTRSNGKSFWNRPGTEKSEEPPF